MKTNLSKRVLTLLLALCLVFSLTACGGDTGSSGSTADKSSSSTAETSGGDASTPESSQTGNTEDGPLTPYAEPVTITVGMQSSAVQQFKDGDTFEDNVWTRKIKEELNIDIEIAFTADISTDAYNNKLNTLLASGDLPDVFRHGDHTYLKQAHDAGYLMDITDVYEQYATDAVKAYQEQFPDCFKGISFDGRMFGYPYMTDNFHQAFNLWIRDDWLENTNSQPPTTVEEMVELAKLFTTGDPDGNGVDGDTFGLGLAGDVLQNNYGTLCGLFAAYGVPAFQKTGIFYRGEDGKITNSYLDPACKDALTVAKELYDAGVFDPEFVVKDVASMETDVATGKIGMMYHACWGDWHPFNLTYQADGTITRPYKIPTVEGTKPQLGILSNQTFDFFMISSKCEHPEALIKILNLYEKTAISGSEEDFQTYWADEQYRFCPIFIGIPTELFSEQVLAALEKGDPGDLGGTALQYYNYSSGFGYGDGPMKDDTNAYGTWGQISQYGSMPIDLAHQAAGEEVVNIMANDIPDIWVQNSSVLGDMVLQEFIDIITGTKPVDHFDQFVTEWLNAGGQETLDELEKLYPAQ
ncbi:extracellular solute-binding protein [Acutalibacter intestini]|uniref:extracellular solute-binding protein n=1 Tax=Acutalibacter intestini TaxID=3093659 RepID=UPI002AC98C0F|nr:extracellular solute-binding protein [Acutalibacter sp. M00204]